MPIEYKIGRAKLGGQEKTFPKLVPGDTVTNDELDGF